MVGMVFDCEELLGDLTGDNDGWFEEVTFLYHSQSF